ncbi:LexA family transcriptional regulator [Bacteroides eggerthii]|jgi:bacteriophage CI repressor helix-turn-helix domain|nr:S24 family peptidase [Bacteroides eggerthii]DAN67236.1 MAG TPA: putative transcriptional regulator [Caudoviricetes sp.]
MDKKGMLDAMVTHYTSGNKAKFAQLLGVSAQTISAWGARNTFDSELIYTKCIGLSPDWLLTGEGSMLRADDPPTPEPLPSINQEYKGAPYYNVDFIGGFEFVSNDQTQLPDYYINYPPYNKPGVMWCNLTGHSMEPEISNGDVIALKEVKSPIEYLPAGEIYGIITDDYRTVKRIRPGVQKGFVRLIPANKSPEFCEQEIPVEMIRRVFAVLGSIRKFF